jgi:hypothetical protein
MSSIRYSWQILNKLEFSRQIIEKHANIKFIQNTSSGSQVVLCGETNGSTDMTKAIVALRNFANASNDSNVHYGV